MERLTTRDTNCADPKVLYGVLVKNHDYISAANRLADYEDTGLTPEEVSALIRDWCDLCTIVGECGGISRVRELDEADRAGRLVVLPCKVGDTVYKVITIQAQKPVLLETQVKTLGQAADVAQLIGKKNKVINIFLTREEAEKALEAMMDE